MLVGEVRSCVHCDMSVCNITSTSLWHRLMAFHSCRRQILGGLACAGTGYGLGTNHEQLKRFYEHRMGAVAYAQGQPATQLGPSPTLEVSPSLLPKSNRAAEIMKFGYPGFDNLKTYDDFVLSYDQRNRTANWVMEHLTPDRMTYDPSVDRSKCSFKEDQYVHPYFRSKNSDYKGSGYDRGHLAAAGNHRKSQNSVNQTFFLSNMSPQVGQGFNRDKWNDLERHIRKLVRKHPNTFICTGPLYLPKLGVNRKLYVSYEVIGSTNVAVPTHFFKVVLYEVGGNEYDMECYIMPNEIIANSRPITDFFVPLDSIERAAGIIIFNKLTSKHVLKLNGNKPPKFLR